MAQAAKSEDLTGIPPAPTLQVRAGVAAIVQDAQGRVLLHRRRVGGGWAPPSGHVEPGESLQQALRREILEETGLAIRDSKLVGVYSDPDFQLVDFPDGSRVQFVTALFRCRTESCRAHGTPEATHWAWCDPGAWPEPLLPYARIWLIDALDGGPVRVR